MLGSLTPEERLKQEEEFRKKYPDVYEPYKWGDALVAQYPHLFRPTKVIPVGIGWSRIIQSLLSTIDSHVDNLPEELKGQIYIDQIKEKFGGLRFSLNHSTPYLRGAIHLAEELSEFTCEDCGDPGRKRPVGGWVKCRCDSCHTKAEKKLEEDNKRYKAKAKK